MHNSSKFYDPLVWYLAGAAMHGTGYNGGSYRLYQSSGYGFGMRFGNGINFGYACGRGDFRRTYGRHHAAPRF